MLVLRYLKIIIFKVQNFFESDLKPIKSRSSSKGFRSDHRSLQKDLDHDSTGRDWFSEGSNISLHLLYAIGTYLYTL